MTSEQNLRDIARALGRQWAEDEAASGNGMFAPTPGQAKPLLEVVVRQIHNSMAEEMAGAAVARRDELVAAAGAAASAEESAAAEAAASTATAEQAKAEAEWQERQAKASAAKRERQAVPPAPAPIVRGGMVLDDLVARVRPGEATPRPVPIPPHVGETPKPMPAAPAPMPRHATKPFGSTFGSKPSPAPSIETPTTTTTPTTEELDHGRSEQPSDDRGQPDEADAGDPGQSGDPVRED
jgi:hypothetical protein